MSVVALLTGRGGSSFKNKNIAKLFGKTVLSYPCLAAKKVKQIDDFYVSSDDNKIIAAAQKFGFKKIKRPKKYAKNNTEHREVLLHALKYLRKKKIYPKTLVVLLANAPIIKCNWIEESLNLFKKKNASAVVPVIQDNDKHPLRSKRIVSQKLVPFINTKKKVSTNRQQLLDCYFLCHNFWIIKVESIYKNDGYLPWTFMGKKNYPYKVKFSHDIHDDIDIEICKLLLKKKRI